MAIGAGFVSVRGIPKYTPQKLAVTVEVTQPRIDRGLKLAGMLCRNCHFSQTTNKLTGRNLAEVGTQFGVVNSLNITKDPEKGIGKWTDGDLIYFLRTGVRPDGQYVPPYMPKLPNISDEDLLSIIAFLRSDHPWVDANPTELPPTQPSFLTKMLCQFAFKPFNYPTKPIANPDTTNTMEWGRYITLYQLECYACHSKDFKTNNYLEPEKSEGFFAGGNMMLGLDGKAFPSRNLTPDETTGIGNWTEEQFIKAVKFGLRDGKPALRYPMLPYSQLTDSEAKAILTYLKTVPKINHAVPEI
ncbi:cytochrome c [Sphingobacteriales bacterium TSM_CSM]|nr:cytochrome c [Sphingobacteriales bacterium TSM_CSM]